MRQIIFDTETTGFKRGASDVSEGHRIIEIGCIELIDRRFTGRHFHQYLNPERPIDPEAMAVHGISDERVAREPTFAQIFPELMAYLDGADELIAHNMSFDQAFLNRELAMVGAGFRLEQRFALVDTVSMARQQFFGQRVSLDALCKRFGIDTSHRSLHGALLDSKLLGEVYLKLTGGQSELLLAQESEPQTVVQTTQQSAFSVVQDLEWALISVNDKQLATHEEIMVKVKILKEKNDKNKKK